MEEKELPVDISIKPRYGPTPSVVLNRYDGVALNSSTLMGRSLHDICFKVDGQTTLEARMFLVNDTAKNTDIWEHQLRAYTHQFVRLYDSIWKMGLAGKIEYAGSEDLDNIWGKIYEQPRFTAESDADYMKRLQVYIAQLTGCGTTHNCEQVISALAERPNVCRIDTYWPAYVRIHIIDDVASRKVKSRLGLINYIIPKMLAVGIDWRLYNNFYDLPATMGVMGNGFKNMPAYAGILDTVLTNLDAACRIALNVYSELPAYICLKSDHINEVPTFMGIQTTGYYNLPTLIRLTKSMPYNLSARAAFARSVISGMPVGMALAKNFNGLLRARMSIVR